MSYDHQPVSPMFRIDVSAETEPVTPPSGERAAAELLRQLVAGQQRQNQLLETLIQQNIRAANQRNEEISQWKEANPMLAERCRDAAEVLAKVQTEFLDSLATEVIDNDDYLVEGEYMMNEFVDRFGPRMAHLNGMLQVLAQLSNQD